MLDKYFGNVCELVRGFARPSAHRVCQDLMFSIDVSHHILDEMAR
jgi:hypothetical protein